MRKIKIFDTTLRDGEQAPGCTMHQDEKVQFAKMLQKLNVDIIEAGFAASSESDFNAIKAISKELQNSDVEICSLSRANFDDIDKAILSLAEAKHPRLHIFIATSPLHRKYKLHMTCDEILERVDSCIRYAKKHISNIEFSAEDAMRTESDYLVKVYDTAIKAGATTVNITDTVGFNDFSEIANTFTYLKNHVEGADTVDWSVHCHNDLGMAVANTLSAIKVGANQVEVSVNGIGERGGNASLEEIVMTIATKGESLGVYTDIVTKNIFRTSKLLANIIGSTIPPNKPIVGANAFAHESGIHQHGVMLNRETYEIFTPESVGIPSEQIVLGKHSGRHAFLQHIQALGITLPPDRIDVVFNAFKELADKKKAVSDRDLMSIITHNGLSNIKLYELDSFSISTHTKGAWAGITLTCRNEKVTRSSEGNGVIDAVFKAINLIIEKDVVLHDYSVNAVTEGEDALGEAVVKLTYLDTHATGRGVSTDVIEASVLAYLDGINKMVNL